MNPKVLNFVQQTTSPLFLTNSLYRVYSISLFMW